AGARQNGASLSSASSSPRSPMRTPAALLRWAISRRSRSAAVGRLWFGHGLLDGRAARPPGVYPVRVGLTTSRTSLPRLNKPTPTIVRDTSVRSKATPKNSRFGICDFTGIGCLADSRVRGERLYRDDDRRIIP